MTMIFRVLLLFTLAVSSIQAYCTNTNARRGVDPNLKVFSDDGTQIAWVEQLFTECNGTPCLFGSW